ncbi:MAG: RDD family protein [Verrucomicrobia bacterium]|nr:RDD family protein [Verrucomicrobiota bacterium]
MHSRSRQLFLGAAVAFFFALTFTALAQPAAPAAPEKPAVPAVEPPAAAPAPAPAATPPAAVPSEPAPAAPVAPNAEPVQPELRDLTAAPAAGKSGSSAEPAPKRRRSHRGDNDRVSIMGDTHVEAGELIEGAAVGVMADVTVDGEVTGDAVAVMGDNRINGTVGGNAVAVLGDIYLGPKSKVGGDIVCVTGTVHREPGAEVGGKIIKKTVGGNKKFGPSFERWWSESVKPARLLGFSPGFNWMWLLTLFLLAFYVVLALVFPGGMRRTGDMLVRRPIAVIMAGILSIIALPVLFILLLVTVVGIPVALLVLPIGILLAVLFGKAALYGLVGRGLTADKFHPALAVLVGGLLFVVLYIVPVAGFLLSLLTSFLGFGCAIMALLTSDKKPTPPAPPPVAPVTPPTPPMPAPMAADVTAPPMAFAASAGSPAGAPPTFGPGPMTALPAVESAGAAPAPSFAPSGAPAGASVPVAAAAMPRAGFWIRAGALFIDGLIIAVCFGPWAGPAVLPILALYGALMWKFRGTTVGGIVCGLQVVRLDDRPVDWPTAVVRALACFLSLAVVGLGFVWVAFDDEKQSWHDKIAGTTVVRPPRRVSLV